MDVVLTKLRVLHLTGWGIWGGMAIKNLKIPGAQVHVRACRHIHIYIWVSFPVVLDMYWWKVALLRSIPPKHTPKHSPEAYPEANPQNEDHF
jgi:hypothetical protein